jgi:hypothetical protein
MRRKSQFLLLILLTLFLASSVNAQLRRRPGRPFTRPNPVSFIGLRIGNDFKHDQFLVGGQFWLPAGNFWRLAPGFDYYLADDQIRWQFNGDILFKPRPLGPLYFGGGVAVDYAKFNEQDFVTTVGGNVLLGLEFGSRRKSSVVPFIQTRWTIYDAETFFSLIGGLNLALR